MYSLQAKKWLYMFMKLIFELVYFTSYVLCLRWNVYCYFILTIQVFQGVTEK